MKKSASKKITGGIDFDLLKASIHKVSQEHWLTSAAIEEKDAKRKKESQQKNPQKK